MQMTPLAARDLQKGGSAMAVHDGLMTTSNSRV
jgi:hypothetical protein